LKLSNPKEGCPGSPFVNFEQQIITMVFFLLQALSDECMLLPASILWMNPYFIARKGTGF
jgi:hypothetical protein